MKKVIVIFAACLVSSFFVSAQTEFNKVELNYRSGYSAVPTVITKTIYSPDSTTLDTNRLAEANFYEIGGAAFLNCGLGAEFNYQSHNRYFDTLAGNLSSTMVGLVFKKVGMGPGSLFDKGFNAHIRLGAGYIKTRQVDEIEYIRTIGESDTSIIWKRDKSSNGFYINGSMGIFRDNPAQSLNYFFYSAELSGSLKCGLNNSVSETNNGDLINAKFHKEDSVNIVNVGLELKPLIIPFNQKVGLSLITGANYSNLNSYNHFDPGFNFQVGIALEGFTRFGECARVSYMCVSREDYVSNEIRFSIELIRTFQVLFGDN